MIRSCLYTSVQAPYARLRGRAEAAARVAHEEETQALSRTWRNLQRSLSGERGLWADAASCEALHWKLDKTEDPSRRYAPLALSSHML